MSRATRAASAPSASGCGGAGHERHAEPLGDAARGHLVAHGAHGGRRRADEDEPGRGARLGEGRVLGEEAVAGMDGLGAGGPRGGDDLVLVEIALGSGRGPRATAIVGLEHVQRLAVRFGEDRDGDDAHLAAGADDADGDLTTIGDQDLREGGRHGGGMIAGPSRRGNEPGATTSAGCFSTSRSRLFTAGLLQSRVAHHARDEPPLPVDEIGRRRAKDAVADARDVARAVNEDGRRVAALGGRALDERRVLAEAHEPDLEPLRPQLRGRAD